MSLEAALAAHTTALAAHTTALEANTAAVIMHNDLLKGLAPKADAKPKTDAKADKPAADKPKADKPKADKKKALTIKDVQDEFGKFLDVADKKEKSERIAWVKDLLSEFSAPKIGEIAEEDLPRALSLLQKKIAGEPVNLGEDQDLETEEDDLLA